MSDETNEQDPSVAPNMGAEMPQNQASGGVENLRVHFCEKGNGYIVNERKFLMEASEGALIQKRVDVE